MTACPLPDCGFRVSLRDFAICSSQVTQQVMMPVRLTLREQVVELALVLVWVSQSPLACFLSSCRSLTEHLATKAEQAPKQST